MKLSKWCRCGLAIAAACVLAAASGGGPSSHATFVWVSDVHFDPMADPKLVDSLAQADVPEWPHILASSTSPVSQYGADTNWALFSSTVEAMKKLAADAQFAVVTGDLLSHHFRTEFNRTAKDHDDAAYGRFVQKTMRFAALQIASTVPGKPVLLTLGNNDSDCGDYAVQPNGTFLHDSGALVSQLLGPLANENSERDWAALGNYSVVHPALKNVRVIALNTIYFSPRYRAVCGPSFTGDPAASEMQWLQKQLEEARSARQHVWLVLHIPPGVDGFATFHSESGAMAGGVVPMWKPLYTEQFGKLLAQYQGTVAISLAAHEHNDDFRLLDHSLVLLAPAVSPLHGQNPAFRTVRFGKNGGVLDEDTFFLPDDHTGAEWQHEYDFDAAWKVHRVDFGSVSKVEHAVESDDALRSQWIRFFGVSSTKANVTTTDFPWLFCASGNVTESAYSACVKRLGTK